MSVRHAVPAPAKTDRRTRPPTCSPVLQQALTHLDQGSTLADQLRIGAGNPAAVGVRFGGAQMFLLQDVDIHVGDGYAGIDHNANLVQRVNVYGGAVGLLAYAASPGWQTTVLDSSFVGQREAAVRLHTDSKLSLIRDRFADAPAGIVATPGQTQRLYVQDSVFENIGGAAITFNDSESIPASSEPELVRAQNQLNVV